MRMSLYWKPVRNDGKILDDALKFVLRKKYRGCVHQTTLTDSDIPYLTGLVDAGIKDAEKLISAIEKYGEIEIGEV